MKLNMNSICILIHHIYSPTYSQCDISKHVKKPDKLWKKSPKNWKNIKSMIFVNKSAVKRRSTLGGLDQYKAPNIKYTGDECPLHHHTQKKPLQLSNVM